MHGVLAVLGAFTENESVCKSSPSGSDVHGSTTCIIERGKVEQPAVGVPGPACNRAVYDSAPAEAKDK